MWQSYYVRLSSLGRTFSTALEDENWSGATVNDGEPLLRLSPAPHPIETTLPVWDRVDTTSQDQGDGNGMKDGKRHVGDVCGSALPRRGHDVEPVGEQKGTRRMGLRHVMPVAGEQSSHDARRQAVTAVISANSR